MRAAAGGLATMERAKKRHELTLKKRYELVKEAEKNPRSSVKTLAERFECGKTQVYSILKDKASIIQMYESNASGSTCHSAQRIRKSQFAEVNDLLYEWYLVVVRKNIFPDGPTLVEKAKQIAERLNITNFKASNGWLDKWKAKHNIRKMVVCGESGEVSGKTVESWKERLPEIIEGYTAKNIWNMDESGCFWKALPEKGLAEKGKACHGGKKSKLRLTVAFFVNALGEKEKPIVIWKSAKPRCFKNVNKAQLPVSYFNQDKAWMSGEIMYTVLKKLNSNIREQSRSIILFMDNAGCHPEDLAGKYSNIKIVFLPPNTTSVLQPLDLGIIKTFKVYYRKLLMCHVLAKIEECSSAYDVVKSVTILKAIRWIGQAWQLVSSDTIKKCFRKAGILTKEFDVVTRGNDIDEDPFEDLDDNAAITDLENLMSQIDHTEQNCSVDEFINADSETPVCQDIFTETWESEFFDNIGGHNSKSVVSNEDDQEDNDSDSGDLEIVPRLKTYPEVIQTLEDVAHFLDSKGHSAVANEASKLVNHVTHLQCSLLNNSRQSTLDDFHFTV